MLFPNSGRVAAAILDAILDFSKRSMMPARHHADPDSTPLPVPKSAITCLGGIFARLPLLAAGLYSSINHLPLPCQGVHITEDFKGVYFAPCTT